MVTMHQRPDRSASVSVSTYFESASRTTTHALSVRQRVRMLSLFQPMRYLGTIPSIEGIQFSRRIEKNKKD
jgi:hypothetical protein